METQHTGQCQSGSDPKHQAPEGVPPLFAELALATKKGICSFIAAGPSYWDEQVRAGEAPKPVIQEPRFTRWLWRDVYAWVAKRIEKAAADPAAAAASFKRAKRASELGHAKRRAQREAS